MNDTILLFLLLAKNKCFSQKDMVKYGISDRIKDYTVENGGISR